MLWEDPKWGVRKLHTSKDACSTEGEKAMAKENLFLFIELDTISHYHLTKSVHLRQYRFLLYTVILSSDSNRLDLVHLLGCPFP